MSTVSRKSASPRPKVLVLLAAYNGAPWIAEQLRSILAQRNVDLRLVIRDDCSTDQTRREIEPFLTDPRVKLIEGDAPTGSAAQNYFQLIRSCSADGFDFISLSDQDDVWSVDKVSRACAKLADCHYAGYSSATIARWGDGKTALLTQNNRFTRGDFLFGGIGQGCTFVVTADFYAHARDFLIHHQAITHHIHYHDWALYALARAWNLSWIFDPVPSVQYRQHATNDTGARMSLAGLRRRLSRIRSGWYSEQLHSIAEMCATASPPTGIAAAWSSIFTAPQSWTRRFRVAAFCIYSGRRSTVDNFVLVLCALSGWL